MPAGLPGVNNRTWVQNDNTPRVTVRITRSVWDRLKGPAEQNGRSTTAEAEARLLASLDGSDPAPVSAGAGNPEEDPSGPQGRRSGQRR